jgi:hypothetical protein
MPRKLSRSQRASLNRAQARQKRDSTIGGDHSKWFDSAGKVVPAAALIVALIYAVGYICAGINIRMLGVPGIELPREKVIATGLIIALLSLPVPLMYLYAKYIVWPTARRKKEPNRFVRFFQHPITAFVLVIMFVFPYVDAILRFSTRNNPIREYTSTSPTWMLLGLCVTLAVAFLSGWDKEVFQTTRTYSFPIMALSYVLTMNKLVGPELTPMFGGPEMADVKVHLEEQSLAVVLLWITDDSIVVKHSDGARQLIPRSKIESLELTGYPKTTFE